MCMNERRLMFEKQYLYSPDGGFVNVTASLPEFTDIL